MKHLTSVEQIADRGLLEELFGMADQLRSKGAADVSSGAVRIYHRGTQNADAREGQRGLADGQEGSGRGDLTTLLRRNCRAVHYMSASRG